MRTPTPPYEHKDSFLTVAYRSAWIHTCYNLDRKCVEVSITLGNGERRIAKSIRGAKAIITRHIGYPPHWAKRKLHAA